MVFNKAAQNVCPYCQREIPEPSKDHIIPEFLGGTGTIDSCTICNNTMGMTFEGDACRNLDKVAFSIEGFGLKLTRAPNTLRKALDQNCERLKLPKT